MSQALLSKCAPVSACECTSCSITSNVLSSNLSTQLLRCSHSGYSTSGEMASSDLTGQCSTFCCFFDSPHSFTVNQGVFAPVILTLSVLFPVLACIRLCSVPNASPFRLSSVSTLPSDQCLLALRLRSTCATRCPSVGSAKRLISRSSSILPPSRRATDMPFDTRSNQAGSRRRTSTSCSAFCTGTCGGLSPWL